MRGWSKMKRRNGVDLTRSSVREVGSRSMGQVQRHV
jgi:hypothetical protein